jgi:hypothetical protein
MNVEHWLLEAPSGTAWSLQAVALQRLMKDRIHEQLIYADIGDRFVSSIGKN